MTDLGREIMAAYEKIEDEGKITEMIEAQLTKTIEGTISELFRSYSDFGKSLKKQLESTLNLDVTNFSLQTYNQTIVDTIREIIDTNVHHAGVQRIKEDVEKMLVDDLPAKMNLSDLIEQFKEGSRQWDENAEGNITFIIGSDRQTLTHIYFDEESGYEKYQCRYNMTVDKDGTVFSIEADGKDFTKGLTSAGRLYGFSALLFKLYANKTVIVIDEDDVDTYWSHD